MKIKYKKLSALAKEPTYATDGSGCFDLYCAAFGPEYVFQTGISFEIPPGFVMLVFSRSGHAFKHNVRLANCVGVIDSDYRGELMIKLYPDRTNLPVLDIHVGDRIAQAMIIPIQKIGFDEVEELDYTDRGDKGFGSTGL